MKEVEVEALNERKDTEREFVSNSNRKASVGFDPIKSSHSKLFENKSNTEMINGPENSNLTIKVHKPKEVGMGRIMSYYYPKSIAVFAMIVAIIAGLQMPTSGFLMVKLLF